MAMILLENKKQLLTILMALALGGIAAVLTGKWVDTRVRQDTRRLVKEYQKANIGLVKEVEILRQGIQKLTAQQALLEKAQREIPKYAPQPSQKVGKGRVDKGTVFSGKTPSGKRALTIMIDSLSAVGGLINPGDYVDIIGQLEIPREIDPEDQKVAENVMGVTSVLFQNIQVLAIGTNFKEIGNNAVYAAQQKSRSLNVTLAVDPEEAALISFAQLNGKLQLSLRSPREKRSELLRVASWDTLADYVLEKQGSKIAVPKLKVKIEEKDEGVDDEVTSFIQIFRGGEEL